MAMMRTRTLLALLVFLMIAAGAFAQSDNEFGRASSGAISAITKGPSQFSGSLSLSTGGGHGASFGGEAIKDRLWVFAAAAVLPQIQFAKADLVDAKATAQPVDWANVTASLSRLRSNDILLPSSFLSLRSTTMLNDRMMMNISFSRSGR
jgi:hypothetical protein